MLKRNVQNKNFIFHGGVLFLFGSYSYVYTFIQWPRMIFPLNFLPKTFVLSNIQKLHLYILFQIHRTSKTKSVWFQNKLLLLLNTIQPFPNTTFIENHVHNFKREFIKDVRIVIITLPVKLLFKIRVIRKMQYHVKSLKFEFIIFYILHICCECINFHPHSLTHTHVLLLSVKYMVSFKAKEIPFESKGLSIPI